MNLLRLFNTTPVEPTPPSGDSSWASRFLHRDLKDLKARCESKKTKISTKICNLFRTAKSSPKPAPAETQRGTITMIVPEAADEQVSKSPEDAESNTTTAREALSSEEPCFDSFHAYMQSRRDIWYKSRPIDLEYQERWKIRGIAIFLSIAFDLCASNPTYGDYKTKQWDANLGIGMLIAVLERAATNNGSSVLGLLVPRGRGSKISPMPAANVYERLPTDSPRRIDSMMNRNGRPLPRVPPINIWSALLIALTPDQRELSVKITETVMGLILPDLDVEAFLIRIGDPGQRIKDDEAHEIREHMREVLFPQYEELR